MKRAPYTKNTAAGPQARAEVVELLAQASAYQVPGSNPGCEAARGLIALSGMLLLVLLAVTGVLTS